MAEYIEREAFKQKYLCCGYLPEMSEQEFDEFPAADVAPAVRRRDCRAYNKPKTGWCEVHLDREHPDDFCSYGKRKDGKDG